MELLSREGLRVEAVTNTFEGITRFVDEAADLVVLGLGNLDETELEFVRALRADDDAPRVLVTFPSPARDLAVRALALGAAAYVLEPFYPDEMLGVVRGLLEPPAAVRPAVGLARLAQEVAHTINNPLQILTFLLEKDRVTKKELMDGVPPNVARIQTVVQHLRDYASIPEGAADSHAVQPIAERAATESGFACEAEGELPDARVHPAGLQAALEACFVAVRARIGEGERPTVRLAGEESAVAIRVAAPRDVFRGEKIGDLLDLPFVVKEDREVYPSLARARLVLEAQDGSLTVEQVGDRFVIVARVPRA